MKCPSDAMTFLRCNQILDAAAVLVEQQGLVSFKFSQLATEVGCSTATLYRFFSGKEDVLVCLFLRYATSNFLPHFVNDNPGLSARQRLLLPAIFTFETIRRDKIFFSLREIAVNKLVWQLASDEKVAKFKRRIEGFWAWIGQSLDAAIADHELQATEQQKTDLTQSLVFFMSGFLTQNESELVPAESLGDRRLTYYRHLRLILSCYQWHDPLSEQELVELAARVETYLTAKMRPRGNCENCVARDNAMKAKSGC